MKRIVLHLKGVIGAISAVLGLCCPAFGMTMAELQTAVDAAEDGAAVELTGNVDVTASLDVNGKKLTLTSPIGQRYAFRRSANVPLFAEITDAATDVRLENLEYDGQKSSGQFTASRLIHVKAGCLTLGDGAAFHDLDAKNAGPIAVCQAGRLVMEDGACISNFVNGNYATAVAVGTGGSDSSAKFEMRGGTITGCESTSVKSGDDRYAYGAAVYVYNGFFIMTGGVITGNSATHTVGGLLLYSGNADVSGTAVITGNTGMVANDVYRRDGSFYVSSGYKGRMTIQSRTAPSEGATSPIFSHQSRTNGDYSLVTGLGNVSYQDDPEWVLDGYSTADGYTRWRKRYASTDGLGIVATLTELRAVMKSGDVISFYRDLTLGSGNVLTFDGWVATLKSADGASARIVKTDANMGVSLINIKNGSAVRFENIAIDGGNKSDWVPLMEVASGSQVVLGAGTTVSNVLTTAQGGLVVSGSGTVVTMEPGARFLRCCTDSAYAYGTAVMVGKGGSPAVLPKFEMKGGEITECAVENASAWSSFGGAVYVYMGLFAMSGGRIHGNTSKTTCPGVVYYSGKIELSGTARIDDNPAPLADLFFNSASSVDVKIVGDFRGHVGICNASQNLGGNTLVRASSGATGAWCIFQKHPNSGAVDWCGQLAQDGATINWAEAVGKVDYMSVASVADANAACPKSIAIDPVDLTTLPHTFAGTAAGISGVTVDLDFDPVTVKQYLRQNKGSIPLLSADAPLAGNISFTLPENCPQGFFVSKIAGGCGYSLEYVKGLMLLLH